MDKQIMVYEYNRIPLGNEKNQITYMHNKMDESQKYYVLKSIQIEKYMYCMILFIWTGKTNL